MIEEVLKSSLIVAVITCFFNMIINKKKDTLTYITEERKNWRNQIRDLAGKIEACKFDGMKEKDIKPYLVQLQMNINTYGKNRMLDIEHDSHIWQAIDRIKNAKCVADFEKQKELLIDFLSLMLKNDWERCKREVRGEKIKIGSLFVMIASTVILAVYYFVICNRKNPALYIIFLIALHVVPMLLFSIISLSDMFDVGSNEVIGITREKKEHRNTSFIIIGVIIVMYIFAFDEFVNRTILNDVKKMIYVNMDKSEIYLDINSKYLSQMENRLKIYLNHDVSIVKKLNIDNMKSCKSISKDLTMEMLEEVGNEISPYQIVLFIFIVLNVLAWEVLILGLNNDKRVYIRNVIILQSRTEFSLKTDIQQLKQIHQKLNEVNDRKECLRLIDLEYELFSEILNYWKRELYKKDSTKKYLHQLEEVIVCEEQIKLLKKSKKKVKILKRKHDEASKKTIVDEIEKIIGELCSMHQR